jgi:hypothetical protein
VQALRFPVSWATAQPALGALALGAVDRMVGAAASHGLRMLPVVGEAPGWAALHPGDPYSPPRGTAAYASFLAALVRRYGPGGRFWAAHPALAPKPVREWQIWNEPSLSGRWSVQPFAPRYVALLRASYRTIKALDPGAQVVLAGFPNFSWRSLAAVYRAGGRRWFDLAAVHPYTYLVRNVLRIVQLNRAAMARYGDARKPIVLSEVSWSSGHGWVRDVPGFNTLTEAGQAARVAQALPALAAARARYRIAQVFWYTWLSPPLGSPDAFDYSGLRRESSGGRIVSKPALGAFRRAAARLGR